MRLQVVSRGSRIQKTEGARGFRLELREFVGSRLRRDGGGGARRLQTGTEEARLL